MNRPRVLLVEDEPSIRRFVEMALEDEPIELVQAESLAAARAALAAAPAQLVIADLMLGDGNGFGLLEALAGVPGTRCVAFSAGIGADARARLAAIGVHEVLAKPVSVGALRQCVAATLAAAAAAKQAAPHAPAAAPIALPDTAVAKAPSSCLAAAADDRDALLADEYFGGDVGLLRAYRRQCLEQFRQDVADGDRAAGRADVPALRRLAHGLKSVLRMLGEAEAAKRARRLEDQAAAGDAGAAVGAWAALRERLRPLAASAGGA